jgi:hypothetical protein
VTSSLLIRRGTRIAAALATLGGIPLLVLEIGGERRPLALAGAAALVVAGPIFWFLAAAPPTVLGASAALLVAAVLIALGLGQEGSAGGFDLGLGICLAGVALWTLVAHARGAKE